MASDQHADLQCLSHQPLPLTGKCGVLCSCGFVET